MSYQLRSAYFLIRCASEVALQSLIKSYSQFSLYNLSTLFLFGLGTMDTFLLDFLIFVYVFHNVCDSSVTSSARCQAFFHASLTIDGGLHYKKDLLKMSAITRFQDFYVTPRMFGSTDAKDLRADPTSHITKHFVWFQNHFM